MDTQQRWRLIVATASVVAPLAVVFLSLRYQVGMWPLVALAVGAATSVALAEVSARDGEAQPEPQGGTDS